MKFDVIVGNPPYQKPDKSKSELQVIVGASPIYHLFVEQVKKLQPDVLAMIIPSRWFAGGKGMANFRDSMLNDSQIRLIKDFVNAEECFPEVGIAGGVQYFVWERNTTGDCRCITRLGGKESESTRALNQYDKFVRFAEALPILAKVLASTDPSIHTRISVTNPFGLRTNFRGAEGEFSGAVTVWGNRSVGWIARDKIPANTEIIDSYLVLLPAARSVDKVIVGKPFVSTPPSCCTETYIVCGFFSIAAEAENLCAYIKTRFFRFMVSLRKLTQHNPKDRFLWVPDLPMTQRWDDALLYQRYNLTQQEIEFIEKIVCKMD